MATKTRKGDTYGVRLRAAREAAGFSRFDAAIALHSLLPRRWWITPETIRRYEFDLVEEDSADPVLLGALAAIYGTTLDRLSPLAAAGFGQVIDLRDRCTGHPPRGAARRSAMGPGRGPKTVKLRGRDSNSQPNGCVVNSCGRNNLEEAA